MGCVNKPKVKIFISAEYQDRWRDINKDSVEIIHDIPGIIEYKEK